MHFFFLFILSFCFLEHISFAAMISQENIEVYIINDTFSIYNISLTYLPPFPSKLSYAFLGEKIKIVNASINGKEAKCEIRDINIGKEILCTSAFSKEENENQSNLYFHVVFVSIQNISKKGNVREFSFSLPVVDIIENLSLKVVLPPRAFIAESDVGSSITPTNFKLSIEPNGRQIIVEWKINELRLGDRKDFNILFEMPHQQRVKKEKEEMPWYLLVLISLFFLLILFSMIFYYKKKHNEKIINVLKEDEKLVLNCIKELGEGCKHKDIVKKTGFSKAKVSRILLELQKRKIIKLERVGKNTKIYLEK